MTRPRRLLVAAIACSALVATGGAWPSAASAAGGPHQRSGPKPVLLVEELSSPKALTTTTAGDLLIGQGAFGAPGPVLLFDGDKHGGDVTPVTQEPFNVIDLAVSPVDGTVWAIGGDAVLYHVLSDGVTIVPVLDIPGYQVGDPDPNDQEGAPDESNPYGLTVLSSGDVLIADAAGNDIIRVTPEGTPSTLARFDTELIQGIDSEAVLTTVTEGPDGFVYVGELQGAPFQPGTSHIWRIDPNADGALCSLDTPDSACEVFADGFTAIQDIAFDQKGRLYVYQLAEDGVLAFEEGFATGVFPPAVLLEVKHGKRTELAPGQLSEPGGIVATEHSIFVTDGIMNEFTGRLVQVK